MLKARHLAHAAVVLGALLVPSLAAAQSTIRQPGARPQYSVELEPHLVLGVVDPPGRARDFGLGAGLYATIELAEDGFIAKLNDSVGIGFGLDYVHYDSDDTYFGRCARFVPGPNGTRICTEVEGAGDADYVYLPVVMQWNFWLHRRWSVFGEPGIAVYFVEDDGMEFAPFVLRAGGRFHVSDAFAITLRVGYPTFSLGASFLL